MAAKKGKTTRQYRQAKKAAKPAAKEAFPGKVKASRKDPKIKISAEDKMALQEMKDTAKADLGKNAYLSKADYEAERAKAREAFREKMRTEFGEYGGKKATPEEAAMKDTKAGGRKAPKAKKTKIPAKGPSLVENGKVVSLDRAKEIMSGEKPSAKKKPATKKAAVKKAAPSKPSVTAAAKAATAGEAPAKPATKKPAPRTGNAGTVAKPKPGLMNDIKKSIAEDKAKKASARPTDASLRAKEDAYLDKTKERLAAENKAKANSAKGKTQTPQAEAAKAQAKPEGKPAVKKAAAKPKKFKTTRAIAKYAGKALKYGALASEVGSAVKGSTEKDWREIQRLENKLAAMKGNKPRYKNMGSNKNPVQALTADASNLANLMTLGLVGQTRRGRMDQLNRAIAKESKKQEVAASKPSASKPKAKTSYVAKTASGKKYLSPSHMSSSKMNKTFKVTGAGGSTIGAKYEVKKGDTFSAIAKNAGVSLSELRAANPKIADKKSKYKGGSMIWSGTKVNIPKKK